MEEERPKLDPEHIQSLVMAAQGAQMDYNRMLQDIVIYGTSAPFIYKKPTLWQRIKWPVQGFMQRCVDAWKVLIGRAYINDE